MGRQCAIRLITGACRNLEAITHANARDPQYAVNRFDVALDIRLKRLSRHRNLTHYQCAGKGAKQSTANGADHVVERGRHLLIWFDAVELLDPAVYPEPDRLGEAFQIRVPQRSLDPFDPQPAGMYHCHHIPPVLPPSRDPRDVHYTSAWRDYLSSWLDLVAARVGRRQLMRSKIVETPWPPPTHIVTRPRC